MRKHQNPNIVDVASIHLLITNQISDINTTDMAKPHAVTSNIMKKESKLSNTLSEFRPGANDEAGDPYNMNSLFFNDVVQYKCSCDNYRRLNCTYFCRHCMALRCRSCVAHEVDSQYCQHCLEYIPTIDPKFQMNKCASCYQCPSCQHLLSTSVLSISPPVNDPQQQPDEIVKRTCQLICEFCRWSSDTFIIEGSRVTSNLADFEVQNTKRIGDIISFYKAISQKEKADKKKRRFHSRSGNTMELLKKYGIDNTLSPQLFKSLSRRTTSYDKTSPATKYNLEQKTKEEVAIEVFEPAVAKEPEQLDKLDIEYYYKKDFNLQEISSIEQRLAQVEIQPERVADFKPISKSLSVKRSLRCKECERNLCRSEYSPVSIRFKIQSAAFFHIPELRLRSDTFPMKLKLDEYNIVEFVLQNQTLSNVKVKLDKISDENSDESYDLVLPPNELILGPKDDTADYDYVPLNIRPLNEETQIIFQNQFKVGFYVKIRPKTRVPTLQIRFSMAHDVFLLQNPRENDKTERIYHTVQVSLGPVE